MSACRPSVGSCGQVGGNASPVDRVAFGWGEELVTRPPKERARRIDEMRPGAPVGEQHARDVQRPAPADVTAAGGSLRPGVEPPQQAEHWLRPRVADDEPRQIRRKQVRALLVPCRKAGLNWIARYSKASWLT